MIRNTLIFVFTVLLIYGVMLGAIYLNQANLIHIPYKQIEGTPADSGMPYEDVVLTNDDGKAELHGWFIGNPDSKITVYLFSGNAGNISYMLDTIKVLHRIGYSVFIYDYRTYGKSTGEFNENAMYRDSEAGWRYLTQTRQISASQIVVHGRSLGTAMASWIAHAYSPAALIMESGFSSMEMMSRKVYPWLPTQYLLRWKYDNLQRIKDIQVPTLFIHSRDDELVPYEHSQMLYDASPASKRLATISGDHINGFMQSIEVYTDAIQRFVNENVETALTN